jgi:hypothetical protein
MILQPENSANMIGPWGAGGAWIAKPRLSGLVRENVVWDPTVAGELVDLEVGGFTAAIRAEAQPGDIIDGKGLLFRPKLTSGKIAVRRYYAHDIARRGGLHQEAIYLQTLPTATNLTVVLEDIKARNIAGGGILVQAGSSGTLIFRRCDLQLGASGYPSEIIIKSARGSVLDLVFEQCIGDVQIDQANGPAAGCIRSVTLIGPHTGAMPDWKSLGVLDVRVLPASNTPAPVPTTTPPAPAPTIDWQARATAAEAELAKLRTTLDQERQVAQAQRTWGDLLVQRAAAVSLATGQLMETINQRPA